MRGGLESSPSSIEGALLSKLISKRWRFFLSHTNELLRLMGSSWGGLEERGRTVYNLT